MSFVKRLDDWWRSAHVLACVWFFINKIISIVSEIIGPVSDIATVVVYFHTGNEVWGKLSAVFVGLGWLVQMLFAKAWIGGSGSLNFKISSELFQRMCSVPLGCLCGCLHLGSSMMHLDDCCAGLERHREGGAKAVRDTPINQNKHIFTKMVVIVFKYAPNLMLHAYVLLVNQLSPKYATHRVTGWGLAAQLVSTLYSGYSVSIGVSGLITGSIDSSMSWPASSRLLFTVVICLDTVCSVLRVMLFVAAFHDSVAWALGCWAIITMVLFAYHNVNNGFGFILRFFLGVVPVLAGMVSPCVFWLIGAIHPCRSPNDIDHVTTGIIIRKRSSRVLCCIWESVIVTGVFVSLPFLLTPHGTVFEHGIWSSLAEVTSTGNCIPRAVLYSIVSWLAVKAVSSTVIASDCVVVNHMVCCDSVLVAH